MTTEKSSATGADDERWLTYLEYDRNVQQAVKRLGALSSHNVDEFRALLLKGRDRSRIQEYEAESIRRLQGEAFVGDEELQRALIVLNAEDPRLGDELKKLVLTTGRPSDIDQTVAAIRSQKESPARPEQTSGEPRPPLAALPPEQSPGQAATPLAVVPPAAPEPPAQTSAQAKIEQFPLRAAPRSVASEVPPPIQEASWTRRLAILVAIFVVGAVGWVIASKVATDNNQKIVSVAPPLRPAADAKRAAAPAAPDQGAPQSAAIPAQSNASQAPGPANIASAPDTTDPRANAAAPAGPASAPVPGSRYKVVRGDMLSDIALQAYGDASKFMLIQRANPGLRNGPNRIFYDQVIYIPPAP